MEETQKDRSRSVLAGAGRLAALPAAVATAAPRLPPPPSLSLSVLGVVQPGLA